MSLSSEMKKTENLIHLGYPEGAIMNDYYTARITPEEGVCVAFMVGEVVMVQFFPWNDRALSGHEAYASFITNRATQIMASKGELFGKYPFITTPTTDLLMIKCLIQNAIEEMTHAKNSDRPA